MLLSVKQRIVGSTPATRAMILNGKQKVKDILEQQGKYVGLDLPTMRLLVKVDKNWSTRYTWSVKSMRHFRQWYVDYMKINSVIPPAKCLQYAQYWVDTWGWKIA